MGSEYETLSAPGGEVGVRVRELRTRAERSQAWLARQMQDHGFPWYQATVHRIEAGERAALFKEAEALARIFEVPLSSFSQEAS